MSKISEEYNRDCVDRKSRYQAAARHLQGLNFVLEEGNMETYLTEAEDLVRSMYTQ